MVFKQNGVWLFLTTLWNNGFEITVHGSVGSVFSAVDDLFVPLGKVLHDLRQKSLNITVHPIPCDNVKMLVALSDYITDKNLPVTISLENNRLMPDKSEWDSAAMVLDIVKRINRANIGICFDMGHLPTMSEKIIPIRPSFFPINPFGNG